MKNKNDKDPQFDKFVNAIRDPNKSLDDIKKMVNNYCLISGFKRITPNVLMIIINMVILIPIIDNVYVKVFCIILNWITAYLILYSIKLILDYRMIIINLAKDYYNIIKN